MLLYRKRCLHEMYECLHLFVLKVHNYMLKSSCSDNLLTQSCLLIPVLHLVVSYSQHLNLISKHVLLILEMLYAACMMMMNCFRGMVDRQKAFSLISSRDHCQRSSPSRISDTPRAGSFFTAFTVAEFSHSFFFTA